MKKFWVCFVEGTDGGYGTQHQSLSVAEAEAERLATKCPGKRVFVFEARGCVSVNRPAWEPFEVDDIPF